jgi:glycosyltransferase involved in cell wall biosynthesis
VIVAEPLLTDLGNDPVVTIAIPTFNRALLLKDCIHSALRQSYPHFEVLVSDNASTDQTQEVLFQFTDRRLRIVKHERNIGPLPNLNSCLAEAKGRYVVFVSDDDRIAPHMLARMISVIERKPEIPVVLSLCDVYDSERQATWHTPKSKHFRTGIWKGTELLMEYLRGNIFTVLCSILLRTDVLRAQGGFRTDMYAADMAAWAAMLLKGDAGLVNESCAVLCCHKSSQTYVLPIDEHIEDGRRMICTIEDLALRTIGDRQERDQVMLCARRYLARTIFGIIFAHSERGASFTKVLLPVMWRYRVDLSHIGIGHSFKFAGLICRVVFPSVIVEWIRRLTRKGPEHITDHCSNKRDPKKVLS